MLSCDPSDAAPCDVILVFFVRWLCVLFFCDGDFECRVVVRDSLQLRKEPCEALWNFTCSHGREEGESETKSKICSVVLIGLDDKMTRDMRYVIFKRWKRAAMLAPQSLRMLPWLQKMHFI